MIALPWWALPGLVGAAAVGVLMASLAERRHAALGRALRAWRPAHQRRHMAR